MANVIDALVVTLGLDPKGFTAGSRKAKQEMAGLSEEAKKRATEIERAGANAAVFFSKVRNEALALAAVFTAGVGIKGFVENTIGSAVSLGFMAKNLDMSTESLGAWQHAAQRAGGTADGITAQLKESALELAQVKMGRGSEAATEFYRQGGIDVRNFKTGNEFLLARSKIIHDLFSVDPTRAMLVAQRMGISEDSFNLLKQGPAAVMALVDAQRKNSQITEEQATAALKLNNAWLDFRDRINTVATQMLLRLEPSINRVLAKLQSLAEWVASHQDDIGKWLDKTLVAITEFARGADDAAQAVGGWKVVLAGLLALKVISMVSGLISLAGALVGVAGGLSAIAAAGPLALAAITGVASYKGTEWLMKNYVSEGTRDSIGEFIARTKASLGSKEDARNLYAMTGKNNYPAVWTPEEDKQPQAGGGKATIAVPPSMAKFILADKERKYGLPEGVLDRQWKQESNRGDPRYMLSPAGAKGHFGFMDATAKEYGLKDPGNFAQSAEAAAHLMSDLLKRNGGDLDKALAGYNWGQGNLERKGLSNAPLETRKYIQSVNPNGAARPAGGNTSTTDVHIGELNVHTKATDASGIAVGIRSAIQDTLMPSQSNTGLE